MSAPTPGKWTVRRSASSLNFFVYGEDRKLPIAGINTLIGNGTEEGFANAALIRASKELLEALKGAVYVIERWPGQANPEFFPELKAARKAIEDAEKFPE